MFSIQNQIELIRAKLRDTIKLRIHNSSFIQQNPLKTNLQVIHQNNQIIDLMDQLFTLQEKEKLDH